MKKFISVVLVLSFVVGCGDSSPAGPHSGSDSAYYPLSVGNQWVYSRSGSISVAGIPISTISGENIADITGQVSHGEGFQVYVQEYNLSDTVDTAGQIVVLDSTFTTYMNVTDAGVYSYLSLAGSDSVGFVPFPLQVGATWQFSEEPPMTGEILSLTETVSVPAGTFENCLEMRITWIEAGNTVENVTDFAPNVGRVRNVYTQSYQSVVTTVTSELMSYSVN
ncbi:MAG: hypothetical protein KAR40_18160 [Candidatus Sabulitectum sp.]|nr:hypothetical protein [Candidatus Sabulitectum sp.]